MKKILAAMSVLFFMVVSITGAEPPHLKWNDSVSPDIKGYVIEFTDGEIDFGKDVGLVNKVSFNDLTVWNDVEYTYILKAYQIHDGYRIYSNPTEPIVYKRKADVPYIDILPGMIVEKPICPEGTISVEGE